MTRFRPNVCMVVVNDNQQVLLAERIEGGWQFPQGGIDSDESPKEAMYRELYEEVGLRKEHTKLKGHSEEWFEYTIPEDLRPNTPSFGKTTTGQRQRWYLLRLIADDVFIDLNVSKHPEFKQWRWVSYWHPLDCVIEFKKDVYRKGLAALAPLLVDGN